MFNILKVGLTMILFLFAGQAMAIDAAVTSAVTALGTEVGTYLGPFVGLILAVATVVVGLKWTRSFISRAT